MRADSSQQNRLRNFDFLMKIVEEAEGERNTEEGAFSFLWKDSFVRNVVITPRSRTSIPGLKTFLATEGLDIFPGNSKSKVSYLDMREQLVGEASHSYNFSFALLDEIFDIENNKEALRERCWVLPEEEDILEHLARADIWLTYLLLERLREVAWKKLRYFFKLCDGEICSECKKKAEERREVYFQFIQAVALYEIFLAECIQAKGALYIEESMGIMKEIEAELEAVRKQSALINEYMSGREEELMAVMQRVLSGMNKIREIQSEKLSKAVGYVSLFQLMMADFGSSYNAMCYLLMVFEAMNVCGENMRGIKKLSLQIMAEISAVYEKDMEILQKYNKNRTKRYKAVNKKLEEIMEKYGEPVEDTAVIIIAFMEELCKSSKTQNKEILRGLECKLGYPVYRELGGE